MSKAHDHEALRARDAASADLWFTGPASFTATGARDRRTLLHDYDELLAATRKVKCHSCEGEGFLNVHGQPPCPDCADLRALRGDPV